MYEYMYACKNARQVREDAQVAMLSLSSSDRTRGMFACMLYVCACVCMLVLKQRRKRTLRRGVCMHVCMHARIACLYV